MRNTVDCTIPFQELEAPRQRRLVDGERVLELPQIRLAQTCDGAENAELSHRRPLGRSMSSYSCVTARLTMRSVLQTHRDSRSPSGPVIGLLPRPSMAPMLPTMPSTRKVFICIYIYILSG